MTLVSLADHHERLLVNLLASIKSPPPPPLAKRAISSSTLSIWSLLLAKGATCLVVRVGIRVVGTLCYTWRIIHVDFLFKRGNKRPTPGSPSSTAPFAVRQFFRNQYLCVYVRTYKPRNHSTFLEPPITATQNMGQKAKQDSSEAVCYKYQHSLREAKDKIKPTT